MGNAADKMLITAKLPPSARRAVEALSYLHSDFDKSGTIVGTSRNSCVLTSLTARDILRSIGMDAEVRSVVTLLVSVEHGRRGPIHAIGHQSYSGPGWPGHMVTIVPSLSMLVDLTMYASDFPRWNGPRGMFAAEMFHSEAPTIQGLRSLATITATTTQGSYNIAWLDNPANTSWIKLPDAQINRYRAPVVKSFVERLRIPERNSR